MSKRRYTEKAVIRLLLQSNNSFTLLDFGTVPKTKVKEFQQKGPRSTLWGRITATLDSHYPNHTLTEIQARGGLVGEWEAHYTPKPNKKPAVVGYGPCAGISLSLEDWS